MTKLADEACDLFKGMSKSQHQNELRHMMTHLHTETSVCVCVCACMGTLWELIAICIINK